MFHQKFFAQLVLTFLLLQISHVLSESVAKIMNSEHQVRYGNGHRCSGVLISNFTVLTAASCLLKDDSGEFYQADELSVAIGNLNRFERIDLLTFDSPVSAVKVHGRFNKKTYLNNLALLEVDSVEFSAHVLPILTSSEVISDNLNCYVLGWRNSSSGQLTDDLMRFDAQTKTRTTCGQKLFPFATFCSADPMLPLPILDTCVGEEGSGLICMGQDMYELRGIVSKTCKIGERTQYTDVSQLINWIAISHFEESLKIIDNDLLKSVVMSLLDLIAYYINTPKIADDFEIIKFLF
ncbi:CLUMA_CG009612, isoform A [Clunio marinus]|uniref:CLUMA_CG009612, isoform A n=1 Tax=Clunio marinus TaxID=568069 RepID=A0A1J1I790_9DIPT|nr:CLUMA_CG009612, isoform A [Clunio marinus]